MERRGRRLAGWKGRLLLVLALVAAFGPSWAANYLCPMARAEAPAIRSSCCAHRVAAKSPAAATSFREACHCPIPKWQASASVQERVAVGPDIDIPHSALEPLRFRPSPTAPAAPAPSVVEPTGPPLWVRHQSILC